MVDTVADGAAAVGRTVRTRGRIAWLVAMVAVAGAVGVVVLRTRGADDDANRAESQEPGASTAVA